MPNNLVSVILAAGLGKRMRSRLAKVLHPVAGRPMVLYPVEAALHVPSDRVVVVAGHQSDRVREAVASHSVEVVLQPEQMGTADAVRCALEVLKEYTGEVLILCGDTPLLTPQTLRALVERHRAGGGPLTVLTMTPSDPAGYGRVVRGERGDVRKIVEERDADPEIRSVREVNTGIYVVAAPFLTKVLSDIRPENAQRELYLTDMVEIAVRQGHSIQGVVVDDPDEVMGINSRIDLAAAERVMRRRINTRHMENGVTFLSPESVLIDHQAEIGMDVILYPNLVIQGKTIIGEGSALYPGSRIVDTEIGAGTTIQDACLIESSRIGNGCVIGPFAHLRPGSVLENHVKIGNFVELKKAHLHAGAKANHLTYLGDAEVGAGANIGAGTITCNYDGVHKYRTVIGEGVFIGSDVQLVAPVQIGDGAFIAAGTTVTQDVPPDALAISRTVQTNKAGWAKRKRGE